MEDVKPPKKSLYPLNETTYNHTLFYTEQQMEFVPGLILGVGPKSGSAPLYTHLAAIRPLALYLRNASELQFRSLIDIAVTDNLRASGRFVVTYQFLSITFNQRISVQLFVNETTTIPSLAAPFANHKKLFASAGWLEREVWDMFGCYFSQHGDLRRILTDYGFTGHPLRKDYPLTGFTELFYNDAVGRVIAERVELAQEFRVFHN